VTRWLALGCLLWAAAGLRGEGAATGVPAPVTATATAEPWKDSGFEYCFGATALSVFNASPLAFSPFELGWRFSNGLHLRLGVDVFYYEGLDTDVKSPAQGVRNYSYEMRDLRSSLLYTVPLPGRLRPLAGLTFEAVGGTRKLSGPGIVNPPTLDAWGFLGTGAVLGAEWRLSENWSLEAQGRYTFSFAAVGPVTALGLNMACLF
jgi:hypothetical protein